MGVRKHAKVFLNGLIVVAPVGITLYAVGAGLWWLDKTVRAGLEEVLHRSFPGLGVLVGMGGIYVAGLLARTWLLRWPLRLAESAVEHIPLVKSLYSAIKDLLQFLGGTEAESRGKPCVLKSDDERVRLLGLVTQRSPGKFLAEDDEERIAVYLPMSYQIGGFTFYVPPENVREIEGMSVEELLKLCMTAGVGTAELPGASPEEGEDTSVEV
ncbi:MAG: DUF502 domain-containing protein [Candidatus Brocadiaceae bacterium]|jgi:uncharacterized membrane protein